MKISIFGLGYVGAVSAGCLSRDSHDVIGVDPATEKVDLINEGKSPIIEKDIGEMIAASVASGKLRATTSVDEAIASSDISLICVGTPSLRSGELDLSYVERVCSQIGEAIAKKSGFHTVVARSTMLPGSMRNIVIPTLEKAYGGKVGNDFGVCNNPEFLREGTAVFDYDNPPKTVIGEADERSGNMLAALYEHLDAPLIRTDLETAEMVKYTDNTWHALKVSFANEIGNICKSLNIDGHKVMDIFCQDTKLNLSPYYMKPGFAFGGSCLPKDVRALAYKGRSLDLTLPVIESILPSNRQQVEKGIRMITEKPGKRVAVLGFSFKAGTDDLRESPIVTLIEHLIGKGYDIRLYDKNVQLAALTGANRDYIMNAIPHISALMKPTIEETIDGADTVVIGNRSEEFLDIAAKLQDGQILVDLVRIGAERSGGAYDGICW
ncbi:MAG: UDP-glucose/GDP-mannose dehydrogenase family protein [Armatimonadota bacterium]|nr:UDP-glucose/GDP-mannose dehydrogenase family protein [Armatimonadota bacterium]